MQFSPLSNEMALINNGGNSNVRRSDLVVNPQNIVSTERVTEHDHGANATDNRAHQDSSYSRDLNEITRKGEEEGGY